MQRMGVKSFRGEGKGKGERGKNEPRYPVDKFCTKSIAGSLASESFSLSGPKWEREHLKRGAAELRSLFLCALRLGPHRGPLPEARSESVCVCVCVCGRSGPSLQICTRRLQCDSTNSRSSWNDAGHVNR